MARARIGEIDSLSTFTYDYWLGPYIYEDQYNMREERTGVGGTAGFPWCLANYLFIQRISLDT